MNFRIKLSLSLMGIAAASTLLALGIDIFFSRQFLLMEVKSKVMSIAASTASQISGDGSHQCIRLVVFQSLIIILKNQSQGDAFSSCFYARPLIDVEHPEVAQQTSCGNTNTRFDGA